MGRKGKPQSQSHQSRHASGTKLKHGSVQKKQVGKPGGVQTKRGASIIPPAAGRSAAAGLLGSGGLSELNSLLDATLDELAGGRYHVKVGNKTRSRKQQSEPAAGGNTAMMDADAADPSGPQPCQPQPQQLLLQPPDRTREAAPSLDEAMHMLSKLSGLQPDVSQGTPSVPTRLQFSKSAEGAHAPT